MLNAGGSERRRKDKMKRRREKEELFAEGEERMEVNTE